jgi:hypothetical protein
MGMKYLDKEDALLRFDEATGGMYMEIYRAGEWVPYEGDRPAALRDASVISKKEAEAMQARLDKE